MIELLIFLMRELVLPGVAFIESVNQSLIVYQEKVFLMEVFIDK